MRTALALSVILGTALSSIARPALAETLDVVATFSIIGDFARQVGGDRIALNVLVGPDGDAHVYEPSPRDAARIGAADIILANGLKFETFVDRLVAASGSKATVVELSKGITPIETADDDHDENHGDDDHGHDEDDEHDHAAESDHEGHDHGPYDPHAFQSVPNALIYVANVADAFCAADAAGCDSYRSNAAAYSETLKALDAELKSMIAAIPEERRVVITSHDAFGYLGKEYGIRFLAPEGVSTDAEASAGDVARLIDQVREDRAAAIFVENISNPRLVEQIARETGLQIGGALYSDALSAADGPAATYVELMRHNIGTITAAIGGR